jgi:RPA family protein
MNGSLIRKREVARRMFAYEMNRSTYRLPKEDEKSPTYILTPLGLRVNRVFIVGALLDKEEIKPDSGIWRIRVSDPTSAVYGYVSRFQPDALESLMEIDVPELVAIVGKVRTFEVGARIFVSLRPEYIVPVESDVRDYWVYETAKKTIERIKAMERKEDDDCKLAWQIYNPNLNEYRQIVKQALLSLREGVVAEGEEEEEEIKAFEEEFEFEEEEWDLSDLLKE